MSVTSLSGWGSKSGMRYNPNHSRSSLNGAITSESIGSIYYGPSLRGLGMSSELNLDQQSRIPYTYSRSRVPQLGRRHAKSPSNASVDSFYTTGAASYASRLSRIEDTTILEQDLEDAAKAFAERAWKEDTDFVEREKLTEWLGFPSGIRRRALGYYIAYFEFGGSDIDEAIRQLCNKLYIKEETQQLDRIIEAFSEYYVSQNPRSLWKLADIIHVVSSAIILLNINLQSAAPNSHITSSRFVEDTIRTIRTRLQQEILNSPASSDPPTPEPLFHSPRPYTRTAPFYPNINRRLSNRGRRGTSTSSLGLGGGGDSWAAQPLDVGERFGERWYSKIERELSIIYNRIRAKPILQTRHDEAPTSQSKPGLFRRGGVKLYRSLRGESTSRQHLHSTPGAGFMSAFGHRMSSSVSSLPQLLGITPKPTSSATTNPIESIDSPWGKTGPLLWKPMKSTAAKIASPKRWLNVIATVRSSNFDMSIPTPPGSNAAAGRPLEALSLLHALAVEVPALKGAKVRSFVLTLASGETHMFEIQAPGGLFGKSKPRPGQDADVEVLAWIQACNHHAARYSRAPLRNAVTNVEYGWNGVADLEGDQNGTNDRNRSVLIEDWAAPNLPPMEAQADAGKQLEIWDSQVKKCNVEFAEHGELRGKMMSLYRPGSAQVQKALANWVKKAQYLLAEIVRYETYAETLRNTKPSPQELARRSQSTRCEPVLGRSRSRRDSTASIGHNHATQSAVVPPQVDLSPSATRTNQTPTSPTFPSPSPFSTSPLRGGTPPPPLSIPSPRMKSITAGSMPVPALAPRTSASQLLEGFVVILQPLDKASSYNVHSPSTESSIDSAERNPLCPGEGALSPAPNEPISHLSDISRPSRKVADILLSHSLQHIASVMYKYLVQHGCPDLMSSIDPRGFSSSAVAEGGFGDIWTGILRSDGTKLAIKVLRFTSSTGDVAKKELKRTTREIYNWSKLDHENVNKLMGVIMFRERLGMVSKWMEHGNLRQYLSRNTDVDRHKLCVQIARGVAYLHSVNMVHGDLKACNILVSSTGVIKITDFDYSIIPECSLVFSATTRMGGGTLRWMAPELFLEEVPPQRNTKTDIYALGMTFLETITNDHPYSDCQHDSQIYRKLSGKEHPKRPEAYLPDTEWGTQMWNLLLQCWDFNPASRPTADNILGSLLGFEYETSEAS
ncbi:unnamed protein product [Rhizoctonia solani]|uniref:Uncharacterized protein n=1 Tax=Rhizoctonia solani TaxID=456999 RepID=A0A8H3HFI7_9AGAM|nr:unnamed protein product [Rhizoctonia solani]